MRSNAASQARRFSQKRRQKRQWQRVVTLLAAVVVFCTTYALILPAITMTDDPVCGYTEHIHDSACYRAPEPVMECAEKLHQHDASCYDETQAIRCGYGDFLLHQHTEICYDGNGSLRCALGEFTPHTHTEECYELVTQETPAPEPEETVTVTQTRLVCQLEETVAHTHEEGCFDEAGQPVCGLAQVHLHGDGCYDSGGNLICTLEEGTVHSHGDGCYETVSVAATEPETAPPETTAPVTERRLICGREEVIPHTHTEQCYGADGKPDCGMLQILEHTHTQACLKQNWNEQTLICMVPEGETGEGGQSHAHTADCYGILTCQLPAHTHDKVLCYGNLEADVETAEDWTKTLPELKEVYGADIVAVAQSQLGYTQSSRNVKTDAEGRIQHYTRYGAWYSKPYEDWDAMFVAFCLHYAKVPEAEFPLESNAYRWVMVLQEHDRETLARAEENQEEPAALLFAAAGEHTPAGGDLVFFDVDGNGNADRVGIVAELEEDPVQNTKTMKTIEGDTAAGCVEYQTYPAEAPEILGYGIVPEKKPEETETIPAEVAETVTLTAQTELVVAEAVFEQGVLPADAVMTVTPLASTEESLLAMEDALDGYSIEAMYRFDITFWDGAGNELEPNGSVSVSIRFAEPLAVSAALPAGEGAEPVQDVPAVWNLIHIQKEGTVENLTGQEATVLNTAEDNMLEGVTFESDGFSEYVLLALTPDPQSGEISLADYLSQNNGTVNYNLYDSDGKLLISTGEPVDVVIGEKYTIAFVVEAPNGIHPDDYFLQLPEGVQSAAASGTLVTNNVEIGSWEVNENGFISLHFNNEADKHQNVLFSGSFEVVFEQVDEAIEIDGDLVVRPKEPDDETGYMWKSFYYSYLYGSDGQIVTDDSGNQMPKSINWRITIVGSDGDTPVVGQTITDRLGSTDKQVYDPAREPVSLEITLPNGEVHGDIVISTQKNIDDGIFKWITDESGNYVSWEYTVPETIACTGDNCKKEENDSCAGDETTVLTLEDEDWRYYFRCESFPKNADQFDPTQDYSNTVFNSGEPDKSYTKHTKEAEKPGVVKNASYDAVNEEFDFEATITIPGGILGSHVTIVDDMTVLQPDGENLHKAENTINQLKSVTMIIGDRSYAIPVLDFTNDEPVMENALEQATADRNAWFAAHQNYSETPYVLVTDTWDRRTVEGSRVNYEYRFEFWKWCDCTAENCLLVGDCSSQQREGFCRCWNEQETVTILFQYSTPAEALITRYGGQGLSLENDLELHWVSINPDTGALWDQKVEDKPTVPIPGVISKTEIQQASQDTEYTAIFGITLNQNRQDWSRLETVVIHDEMSASLAYIPGTLVILRGTETEALKIGEDYTLETATGGHGFVVTLLNPQQVEYHMQYSAMVNQEGIDNDNPGYNNKAWVTVDDTDYHSGTIDTSLTEFTFTSKNYQVTVNKVDQSNKPLDGVVFGLFAANGELIQKKTVTNGSVTFETSVTDGIIFQTHSLYYIQELVPKPGYTPDYTKYKFYFCESETCTEETEGVIHFGSRGVLTVENAIGGYELPNTGGMGTIVYSLGGLVLTILSAVLLLNKEKHWKKGGYGSR